LPPGLSAQEDSPKKIDANALFERIDKNADGVVTEDEIPEDRKPFFERIVRAGDKNKDGQLTKDEFAAGLAGGVKPDAGSPGEKKRPPFGKDISPEAFFGRFDKNGDGKITKDEMPDRGPDFIERFDTDKDGAVSKEEFAKGAPKLRPGEGAPRPGAGGETLFRALDENADGRISAEEMSRAATSLKKLDRNGDGSISREELGGPPPGAPAAGAPATGALAERLKQLDKNGDGKISKEEAPDRIKENFDRLDANADGYLDAEEMRRLFDGFEKKKKERKKDKG
jgi:Ca2+-binding EF-hand superfamily protein